MKTSELKDAALDWAVGTALKLPEPYFERGLYCVQFSRQWAHGGPIIEREGIDVFHTERAGPVWEAEIQTAPMKRIFARGPTPLIAAMRCFVASKLGDEVDVPEELK